MKEQLNAEQKYREARAEANDAFMKKTVELQIKKQEQLDSEGERHAAALRFLYGELAKVKEQAVNERNNGELAAKAIKTRLDINLEQQRHRNEVGNIKNRHNIERYVAECEYSTLVRGLKQELRDAIGTNESVRMKTLDALEKIGEELRIKN